MSLLVTDSSFFKIKTQILLCFPALFFQITRQIPETSKMVDIAELMERCAEEIAATVLDAGGAMSYRTLGASSHVSADVSRRALQAFAAANADSVDALEVAVELVPTSSSSSGSSDPRARVIRVSSLSPTQSAEKSTASRQIYGVFKKIESDDSLSPAALACWSQERALRNDIFEKATKNAPLSRAIKAFYESGITCAEATTRTGFGESQGEESVSIFDSVKSVTRKPTSSGTSSAAAPNGSKSFFKSTVTTASAPKARGATSSASASTKSTPVKQPETKKIDAESMSNVFTIDSDDDEDGSDADVPVFVKKASSAGGGAAKSRSKRVISDDEEEEDDEDDFKASKPTASAASESKTGKKNGDSSSSSSTGGGKRKVVDASSSDEKRSDAASESDDTERQSSKRAKRSVTSAEEEQEEQEEEEAAPAVTSKRRVEVTKTRINEQGYMVTEKSFEEVELTAEEVEQERQQAAKRKKQQQAAAAAKAAVEAKAAEKKAGVKNGGGSGGAAAKQKNLFAFFQRK